MSIKACRILQIIAFVLFILALVVCGVVYLLREPLLRSIYNFSAEGLETAALPPFGAICACLGYVLISLVCMIVASRRLSRKGTIALGVTAAALFVVFDVVILQLFSLLTRLFIARLWGNMLLASFSSLQSITSSVTVFLTVPAKVLLFLSLGGLMGKDLSQPRKQFPDGTETAR